MTLPPQLCSSFATSAVYLCLLIILCSSFATTAVAACDPATDEWCLEYKNNSAVFDADPNTPDVTFVYAASEPAKDGDDSKFYQVSILNPTCTASVTTSIFAPHDASTTTSGVIKKSGYNAQDQTVTFGLNIAKGSAFASSPFVTETSDGYTIKFCIRVELSTTLEGLGAIAVAMKDTEVTLGVDKSFEQGFSFAVEAEPIHEDDSDGGGDDDSSNVPGKPRAKGVDANGNVIPPVTGGGLFGSLQAAINSGHKIEATYDPSTGFPIYFRVQTGSPASKDTITITILRNFKRSRRRANRDLKSAVRRRLQDIPPPDYSEITADQAIEQAKLTNADTQFSEAGHLNYEFQLWKQGADAGDESYPHTFEVETPGVMRWEIELGYSLEAFLCNEANAPVPPTQFKPGELVTLCVRAAPNNDVIVENLRDVSFGNDNDSSLHIPIINEDSQEVGIDASLECAYGVCRVASVTTVRMYEKLEADGSITNIARGAKIRGTIIFGFVRRNLAKGREFPMEGNKRILQEEREASGFDLALELATPPSRSRSSAIIASTFVASAVTPLVVGSMLV